MARPHFILRQGEVTTRLSGYYWIGARMRIARTNLDGVRYSMHCEKVTTTSSSYYSIAAQSRVTKIIVTRRRYIFQRRTTITTSSGFRSMTFGESFQRIGDANMISRCIYCLVSTAIMVLIVLLRYNVNMDG